MPSTPFFLISTRSRNFTSPASRMVAKEVETPGVRFDLLDSTQPQPVVCKVAALVNFGIAESPTTSTTGIDLVSNAFVPGLVKCRKPCLHRLSRDIQQKFGLLAPSLLSEHEDVEVE